MNKIYSIVVLYNPTVVNIANFKKIIAISDKVIFVDNSRLSTILDFGENNNKIKYIKNSENIGLSKALNLGIKKAVESLDCTNIALFDQDSVPDDSMFIELMNQLNKADATVVAVGPRVLDLKHKKKAIITQNEVVDVVITSGSFYKKEAFAKVGLMDETFFIDYIDYEWCLRAKSKGYKILKVNTTHLNHNLGDSVVGLFGVLKPIHTNNLRHYYIIRNQLIMLNRDYISFKWKCIHTFKLFYRIPSYIVLSSSKLTTLKYIINAIKDAIINSKEYKIIKF